MTISTTRSVRLFEADPDLIGDLDAVTAARARRHTYVVVEELPVGPWSASETCSDHAPFGFIVLKGVMVRRVALGERCGIEILGSGALLSPLHDELGAAALDCTSSWRVLADVTLAILDQDFQSLAVRWPGVLAELLRRATQRARWLTLHLAIAQHPQLEHRLLLVLWHLADRWGRVEPDGVVISLRLPQETLGELVCARRSSVNAALQSLMRRGALRKVDGGGWKLLVRPPVDSDDEITTDLSSALYAPL